MRPHRPLNDPTSAPIPDTCCSQPSDLRRTDQISILILMTWFAALIAALSVLQAGVDVCSDPATTGAERVGEAIAHASDAEDVCHGGRSDHGVQSDGQHTMEAVTPPQPFDCCDTANCSECAFVTGMIASTEPEAYLVLPIIKAEIAHSQLHGQPLTHEPPPPRA